MIDLHLELVVHAVEPLPSRLAAQSVNPDREEPNLAEFERLLAHSRRAKIVRAHSGFDILGQRTPAVARELLARHPDLHTSLLLLPAKRPPGRPVIERVRVDSAWLEALRAFPDRLLAALPADLARRIGYENAVRLYRPPPVGPAGP